MRTNLYCRLCALFSAALVAGAAFAQSYPDKPVRLIVPTPVSTPVDIVTRVVGEKLGHELGQPMVVENRGGGQGIVGAQSVLQQPSDGYTLLSLYMPMTVGQTIYSKVPYDLRKDFVPIAQTAWSYNVLVVHPSVKANSAQELAALMKDRPGQLSFGSGGPGTPAHIAGELFKQQTGTDALHVPYNQFPQSITDLLTGRIQFMFVATPPVIQHIRSGKLRALALTGPQRIPTLENVPTMIEAGFPDFVVRDWQGLVARAGTPKHVIDKVNAAVAKALATDDVKRSMATLGADPATGTPNEFGKLIASEIERWGRVAKTANIRVD